MTDPARDRPQAPRRKRPHPAAASRVFVVGAAAAGTLAMTGLMTRPLEPTVSVEPTSASGAVPATLATGSEQPTAARIVIVRRHHPAPSSATVVTSSSAAAASASVAPAPAPRPAPRPAPVTSTSGGS